jgi:hypothetical protein
MSNEWINLYEILKEQNETIEKNITERKEKYSTDDQLFNYKYIHFENIKWFNNILFILYYILLFLVIILFVISTKLTITNIYAKIGIIVLLAVFPFIYLWIELQIWILMKYIFYVMVGYVYHQDTNTGMGNINL